MIHRQLLALCSCPCSSSGPVPASRYWVGIPSTVTRRVGPPPAPKPRTPRRAQPCALSAGEWSEVRALLNSRGSSTWPGGGLRHPARRGRYMASGRACTGSCAPTARSGSVAARPPTRPQVKPELVATGPNQCWSWDITKLRGPAKWTYYHLYVIIDIYSRYVVGWLLADAGIAALAERLLAETIAKQHVDRDQLTIHADRGTSMASKPVAMLLADLGRRGVCATGCDGAGGGVSAVLAGARTYVAIAEWAHDLPASVRVRLGIGRRAPSESTIRRILQTVDADALDRVVSRAGPAGGRRWASHRTDDRRVRRVRRGIGRDGCADADDRGGRQDRPRRPGPRRAPTSPARGARPHQRDGPRPAGGRGKDQRDQRFRPVAGPDRPHRRGRHRRRPAHPAPPRRIPHERGAHYLLIVKGNQPTLHRQLRDLPWAQVPAVDPTHHHGHGRVESRTVKLAAVSRRVDRVPACPPRRPGHPPPPARIGAT